MLIETNLHDLIEATHCIHYAAFRASKMQHIGRKSSILPSDDNYAAQLNATKDEVYAEMNRREESMRSAFVLKIQEKETELRGKEEEVGD